MNSQRVPPCSAREGSERAVQRSLPDHHNRVGRHSPANSKLSDELREYLADQPRLVLIGVSGVARPFFHLPFHSAASSHGEQENNAAQN